jgi:hypothetical protein
MVIVEEVEFAEFLMGIISLQYFVEIMDFVDFENWFFHQILNLLKSILVLMNDSFEIFDQIFQILINYFIGYGFALCEVEALDFELTLLPANQIDIFLSEHYFLFMLIAHHFFLFLWLFLKKIHFFHQFYHFLVRLQLT